MEEYEMIKTTLVGGYKKEEVQELIQRMQNEKAEAEAEYRQQLAEKDAKIAELQKRIELKEDYQLRLEDEIKEKYQKYVDNFESIGKLVFEAQVKADAIEAEGKKKSEEILQEAETEANNRIEAAKAEVESRLAEGERSYQALQEKMNRLKEAMLQIQENVTDSCQEILQMIGAASEAFNSQETEDSGEELQEEEVDDELDFLDSLEDLSELDGLDEEDEDEDEDSRVALQISKLLSEEDEAMLEEELDDL